MLVKEIILKQEQEMSPTSILLYLSDKEALAKGLNEDF